jgi:hypothetical protein
VPLDHEAPDGPLISVFAREVADPDGRDRPFMVFLQGGPGFEAPRPTRFPSHPSWLDRSFGGFCVTTYLSLAPDGLREALITGGLPPLRRHIDEIYPHTYARVLERNRRYFERYPGDRERLMTLHGQIQHEPVQLPGGDRLTWRRVRQLGWMLGMSDGAEHLHSILELPSDSPAFLHDVEYAIGFARNPIYAILHEAGYADGGSTRWSAERLLPAEYDTPELLTGEHVYPWMFDDYGALAPLREAAELFAEREWPYLYDPVVLGDNRVPAAAAIFADDMYVERTYSEETAGAIHGLRPWVTNEYDHNGVRVDGDRILGRLIDLARRRI